jgi:hypothetical protein
MSENRDAYQPAPAYDRTANTPKNTNFHEAQSNELNDKSGLAWHPETAKPTDVTPKFNAAIDQMDKQARAVGKTTAAARYMGTPIDPATGTPLGKADAPIAMPGAFDAGS